MANPFASRYVWISVLSASSSCAISVLLELTRHARRPFLAPLESQLSSDRYRSCRSAGSLLEHRFRIRSRLLQRTVPVEPAALGLRLESGRSILRIVLGLALFWTIGSDRPQPPTGTRLPRIRPRCLVQPDTSRRPLLPFDDRQIGRASCRERV